MRSDIPTSKGSHIFDHILEIKKLNKLFTCDDVTNERVQTIKAENLQLILLTKQYHFLNHLLVQDLQVAIYTPNTCSQNKKIIRMRYIVPSL